MRVAVVGAGYVGLVSGACFSDFGHLVTCIDTDAAKVERLKSGGIPIFEPGLDVIVKRNHDADRLVFTTECGRAISGAYVVLIADGTPSRRGEGLADVSVVREAARQVARYVD